MAATTEEKLRALGIGITTPRLLIAQYLSRGKMHVTAEQIYDLFCQQNQNISRATVYNTLHLFVAKGIIGQVVVDNGRTFYDTNLSEHCHIFNLDTQELFDIEAPTALNGKDGVFEQLFPQLFSRLAKKDQAVRGEITLYTKSDANA